MGISQDVPHNRYVKEKQRMSGFLVGIFEILIIVKNCN